MYDRVAFAVRGRPLLAEPTKILKVAVPAPLAPIFDYLAPMTGARPLVGARVRVPFGRRTAVGVIVAVVDQSELPATRLRRVMELIDNESLLAPALLDFVAWAARYYHYPFGEALASVLPGPLRRGRAARPPKPQRYRWMASEAKFVPRSPAQAALVDRLRAAGADGLVLETLEPAMRARLHRLVSRGLVEPAPMLQPSSAGTVTELNAEQRAAAAAIVAALDTYVPFLLEGVTGSGKTEVYLSVIREVLARGRQVLVIVPEIALTPQLVARFEAALGVAVESYHSGLPEGERLRTWLDAAAGSANVIVGTRSSVFLPLARPGLIVIDEEHDSSLKQQDGFRYHARDLAVYRARAAGVPAVLGSATPSLESLANVRAGRYRRLALGERVGGASLPSVRIVDVRGLRLEAGLSQPSFSATARHLTAGGQVLFFLNRRGFAPLILCHACGAPIECRRCSARMIYHRAGAKLVCHHCGAERRVPDTCPSCGAAELVGLGKGTERLEAVLAERFPDAPLVRVDRDATRRRGRLAELMAEAASGRAHVLVGTQMLAKGHDFEALTLAVIVDADQGLYGTDFRAPERMAQLIVQVAGRAGRRERTGEVLIQTRHPDHPMLAELTRHGYAAFAESALAERKAAGLPPFGALAVLRAEASREAPPRDFLAAAAKCLGVARGLRCSGPAPAPLLRRAGRYRYQLILEAGDRNTLQATLARHMPAIRGLPGARRVRLALDVDPVDLS